MTIRERLHRAEHPHAADGRYEPMARAIHAREMLDLDVLLIRHDPESPRWHEQAADAGHAAAMVNPGVLLAEEDLPSARAWFE